MKISIFPAQIPANGFEIYRRLADYISKTDTVLTESYDADAAVIWSVLWNGRMSRNQAVWQQYRRRGKPVIVIEVGGLIRSKTWRLSANGITRSAIFPSVTLDPDRPKKLGLIMKPWHDGEYVLICGQHGKSEQWNGMPPMDEYYKATVTEIKKHTDRPIVIRSHPRYRERLFFNVDEDFYKKNDVIWNIPKHIQKTYDSFDLEPLLAHSHCVISHTSNSGISAVIEGTPAIVSSESLAYPVGTNDLSRINSLPRPDRDQWLLELCHKEWFEDELEHAWRGLRNALDSQITK